MLFSGISLALGLTFASLASCSPVPQGFDFDSLDDFAPIPTPTILANAAAQVVTVNEPELIAEAAAAPLIKPDATPAARVKRQTGQCELQPVGYGPKPDEDTAAAFVKYQPFSTAATSAQPPTGYTQAFSDLKGSVNGFGYLGYNTVKTYDVNGCAAKCSTIKNCAAFDIYYERAPSVDPGVNCPNPASTTLIKCAYWGGPIKTADAVNTGQWRKNFQVVIAGSNGYVDYNRVTPAGYSPPAFLDNAAIEANSCADGISPYLGYKLFNDGAAFNIERCAAACTAQAASDSTQKCVFFNTYILLKNGAYKGQYCSLYSAAFDKTYATNVGQYDDQGNHFTITYSYSSFNSANQGFCPKSCGNEGLNWGYFAEDPAYNDPGYTSLALFDPSSYASKPVKYSGITTSISGFNLATPGTFKPYGSSVDANNAYFVLQHTGYIYAAKAGIYNFQITSADDIVYVWTGTAALTGYNKDNILIRKVYTEGTAPTVATVTLSKGQYLPIRIMYVAGNTPNYFHMTVTNPDGKVLIGENTAAPGTNNIIRASCDGTSAPAFSTFRTAP